MNKRKARAGFTKIYNAFLDFPDLSQHDKMVYIAIKSFADNTTKQAYPSLATISRVSGVSIAQVRRSIHKMQDMNILKVERRRNEDNNGNMSNLYTLYDSPEMWKAKDLISETEDFIAVAQELPDDILEAEYQRRKAEKEKASISAADQSTEMNTKDSPYLHDNLNTAAAARQEGYSEEFLKEHYDYAILAHDYPDRIEEIDYLFKILYDTLNSSSETIRVQRQDRPREVVVAQLLKLDHMKLMYVLDKYAEQTNRINNPKGYLLTQLYDCSGQMNLDIDNQVRYDFHQKE